MNRMVRPEVHDNNKWKAAKQQHENNLLQERERNTIKKN